MEWNRIEWKGTKVKKLGVAHALGCRMSWKRSSGLDFFIFFFPLSSLSLLAPRALNRKNVQGVLSLACSPCSQNSAGRCAGDARARGVDWIDVAVPKGAWLVREVWEFSEEKKKKNNIDDDGTYHPVGPEARFERAVRLDLRFECVSL